MEGKGFLKVVGILMIIFAGIGLVFGVIGLIGAAALSSMMTEWGVTEDVTTVVNAAVIISCILSIIGAGLEMATGIIGVKFCDKPKKANVCLVMVIILLVLEVISLILTFVGGNYDAGTIILSIVTGLAMPVLYLIGVCLNKKGIVE